MGKWRDGGAVALLFQRIIPEYEKILLARAGRAA